MRKFLIALGLVAMATSAEAQITLPNTLKAGEVIRSSELNTNFLALGDKSLNRITGGSILGNVSLATDVTIDGVDISDFLLSTGEVRAQTLGTVANPAFTFAADNDTGLYSTGPNELAATVGGVQRLLLNSSGLTVFGVNILNGSGKIPDLSSTYFASLDGSNLTTLNASAVALGTLSDSRLSSNVPLKSATTNTFTGNASFAGTLGVTGTSTLGTVSAGATSVTALRLGTSSTSGFVLTTDASGNGTWQSPGVATGAVPSGLIAMFDTSCPATWTRFAALDDKFPRGGASYAAGGGSDTHTHTVDPAAATSSADGAHAHTIDPIPYTTTASGSHTHSFSSGGSTSFAGTHSHTGSTSIEGSHTHTMSTSNWTTTGVDATTINGVTVSETNSAGSHSHTFGTTSDGGHTHTLSLPSTDASGTHTHDIDILPFNSVGVGPHTHTVDVASTTSSSASNVPAYVQMVFCKKD